MQDRNTLPVETESLGDGVTQSLNDIACNLDSIMSQMTVGDTVNITADGLMVVPHQSSDKNDTPNDGIVIISDDEVPVDPKKHNGYRLKGSTFQVKFKVTTF